MPSHGFTIQEIIPPSSFSLSLSRLDRRKKHQSAHRRRRGGLSAEQGRWTERNV